VLPDFQGGTLEIDQVGATDNNAYNVQNFPTNTIDEFGNTITFTGGFSGPGPLTISDSVGGGNVIVSTISVIGGTVTINNNATLQWGNGNSAALAGTGGVVDNGALVTDFGTGNITANLVFSGSGTVTAQSGTFGFGSANTYTGATTIDSGATLQLQGAGSIATSSVVADNGTFDISGTTSGTSIKNLTGSGGVSLGAQTLTITNAAGTLSGVIADGGQFGGTGGGLTIAGGTETLSATNTFTGTTTINGGATLQLGAGGTTGTVAGPITDNGLLKRSSPARLS
jgi:autotransporter-associated beta strand protein